MIGLRTVLILFLLAAAKASVGVGDDIARTIAAHPFWIQEGLAWEPDPGEKQQSWAAAEVLYFGQQGEFGVFDGIVLRCGKKLTLGEGEGQLDHLGSWKAVADVIQVDYRLVVADKIIPHPGQKPPEVPGPPQHDEVRLNVDKNSNSKHRLHMKVRRNTFEMTVGFESSDISSHFQELEKNRQACTCPEVDLARGPD